MLNRKYSTPSTNGRPAHPLVRYSALQRSYRFAFVGRLSPPPAQTPASLSPSLRGGVPFFAPHLRTSHGNLASGGRSPMNVSRLGSRRPALIACGRTRSGSFIYGAPSTPRARFSIGCAGPIQAQKARRADTDAQAFEKCAFTPERLVTKARFSISSYNDGAARRLP